MRANRFEYACEEAIAAASQYNLFPLGEDTPVVAMVSGGSDSTALAYILSALSSRRIIGRVEAVHINHCLRGADSDGDEEFVKVLCNRLGIGFAAFRIDISSLLEGGGNMEAVARDARYAAANEVLDSLCDELGIDASFGRIAVAHTVDDRLECFYMRSIVGTGPGGFRSMRYANGRVVRPLLELDRQELRDAIIDASGVLDTTVDGEGNHWREDATNADTDRFRAYVRHGIVPRARKWNPSLNATMTRTMNLIAEEDDMLGEMADEMVAENCLFEYYGDGTVRSCTIAPGFAGIRKPLARRCIYNILTAFADDGRRIENRCIEAVLSAFGECAPISGYKNNIKGNLAVSANKRGVVIERMAEYVSRTSKRKQPKREAH